MATQRFQVVSAPAQGPVNSAAEPAREPVESSTATAVAPAPSTRPRPKQMTPWNVVLLDSDDHSWEYVIKMMRSIFGHTEEHAFQIADRVNADGRAICMTTHKELAELKRDQVLAFGKDPAIQACKGSMYAVIEPAEG